ncbi:protein numb [Echinococcus multilocularis]|uniref:Protein numb n=1 Tax=Echinococcus multilocularis TaxID=6211 RepID=A0A068Y890_ECHMU|nr:protein numb [Echinococcus multilocularis]
MSSTPLRLLTNSAKTGGVTLRLWQVNPIQRTIILSPATEYKALTVHKKDIRRLRVNFQKLPRISLITYSTPKSSHMDRFRKSLSVRKKKQPETTESSRPQLWIEDERKIKEGSCSFQVKYLGCIEVFESRGMQVCEEAIKALRKSKKKTQRAILYVSGDALRVSDEISKHLIVDQTIEKVSFCAPDRGHDKGFAYICRDGATRRWMCHAFLAIKESGERLSHAVGCAFAICLERKQKRERDAVQATYANEDGTFVRMSSFRQTSLSERLLDPQSAIVVDHPAEAPFKSHVSEAKMDNGTIVPFEIGPDKGAIPPKLGSGAIPRPRASPSLIERQTSLRLFPKLQETSPFKHHFSMRSRDPGALTLQRTNLIMNGATIPEETSTELEETSGTNHSAESMTLPLRRTSQTPQPAKFAFRNPLITGITRVSPTFPVSFDEIDTSANGGREEIDDLLALDPFSAAPFNPATIQQHQAAQQQQLRSLNNFSSNTTSSIPPCGVSLAASPALFPLSDWPDIADDGGSDRSAKVFSAPFTLTSMEVAPVTSFPDNSELTPSLQSYSAGGNASHVESSPLFHFPSSPTTTESAISSSNAMILFGADVKCQTSLAESSTVTTMFAGAQRPSPETALTQWLPGRLPPKQTTFGVDPFDLDWAERATAVAKGQLAACFLASSTTPLGHLPAALPPHPPTAAAAAAVCTNPFLVLPPDER